MAGGMDNGGGGGGGAGGGGDFTELVVSTALRAIDCPAVQVPTEIATRKSAFDAGQGASLLVSYKVPGPANRISSELNANAMQLDLTGRYGGGCYAVAWGLDLSAPTSGLLLQIAAGHAMIDGVVEVAEPTTIAVPDNQSRVWVWLARNGTLSYATDLTPPVTPACLLGSCQTAGGSIAGIDHGGTLRLRGGLPWRETYDEDAPTDRPPENVSFFARTRGGIFLWDGSGYNRLDASSAALWVQVMALRDRLWEFERVNEALVRELVHRVGLDELIENETLLRAYEMAAAD